MIFEGVVSQLSVMGLADKNGRLVHVGQPMVRTAAGVAMVTGL